jgi:hypothetical protein
MHPPFFHVDHKIGPDIHTHGEVKYIPKRTQPTRLSLSHVGTVGWPPVPLFVHPISDVSAIRVPSGQFVHAQPVLQIVPPPQRTFRDIIGRFLIRAGQRLILEGRA